MNDESLCPRCGKPLPAHAPHGLCPSCLILAGLGSSIASLSKSDSDSTDEREPFKAPLPEELGSRFPQLDILELLGCGGMGAVYKVRQKQLGRLSALKVLPPGRDQDKAFAERFVREAQALARLNHPHIVTLYEFGQADGLYYFLMELVDGLNLAQLFSGQRISPREALVIVPQICDALQYAHDRGVVHRDIKPENILLSRDGQVKIADFGVARILAVSPEELPPGTMITGSATEAGHVVGTSRYMAPEQLSAPGEVDHRADIYSLGVVFYQMLTGETPGGKLESPSQYVQIDVRLDEIVLRALQADPRRRYQQVSELRTAVETVAVAGKERIPGQAEGVQRSRLARLVLPGGLLMGRSRSLPALLARFVLLGCYALAVLSAVLWGVSWRHSVGIFSLGSDTSLHFLNGEARVRHSYDHDFEPPVTADQWRASAVSRGWRTPPIEQSRHFPNFCFSSGHVIGITGERLNGLFSLAHYWLLHIPLWATMLPGILAWIIMRGARSREEQRRGFPVVTGSEPSHRPPT